MVFAMPLVPGRIGKQRKSSLRNLFRLGSFGLQRYGRCIRSGISTKTRPALADKRIPAEVAEDLYTGFGDHRDLFSRMPKRPGR